MSTGQPRKGWGTVIAYALVVAATQMLWLTFAPIDTDVARDFGVSKNAIGWLANVFPLLYVLLALPAGVALDRWFRRSLSAGAVLTACGGLLRLAGSTFGWALAGQLLVAIAQPLVLNSLTKTATGYLPEADRPTGIAVGSGAQFLGAVIALAMGPLLEHKHSLGPLLPVQAGLATAAAIVLVVLLARRPPADSGPPAAAGLSELRKVWGVDLIRRLAMLAFVGVGVFVALSTWLQTLLHHDRISSDAAGAMLVGMLVAGTIGCGVVPPAVARRSAERQYVTFVVVWVGAMFACLAAAHPLIAVDFVVIALIGFVLLAALPVLLEVAERRMGESGGVATGILLLAGNAGGLVLALIIGGLINVPTVAFLVLGVAALLGLHPARRLPLRFRDD